MASVKDSLRGFVSGSMGGGIGGQSSAPAPAGPRPSAQRQAEGRRRLDGAAEIALDRIVADPGQPRTEFDSEELEQLAASVRARGVLQPIRCRWDDAADRYIVIMGERRFRAAAMAGLATIPAVVSGAEATPEDLLEDQLVENAVRSDLRPVEQAHAYRRLIDARGYTQQQLADRLHVSQASVSQALKLLTLPEPIRESIDAGFLAPDVGYRLASIADPNEQAALAQQAARGELGRDEIRERTKSPKPAAGKGRGAKASPPKPRPFRTALGKVTCEWRRQASDAEAAAALREIADQLDPQPMSAQQQDAA